MTHKMPQCCWCTDVSFPRVYDVGDPPLFSSHMTFLDVLRLNPSSIRISAGRRPGKHGETQSSLADRVFHDRLRNFSNGLGNKLGRLSAGTLFSAFTHTLTVALLGSKYWKVVARGISRGSPPFHDCGNLKIAEVKNHAEIRRRITSMAKEVASDMQIHTSESLALNSSQQFELKYQNNGCI